MIELSKKNISELNDLIEALKVTLTKGGFDSYNFYLLKIQQTAEVGDENAFKEVVINNGLFGGAGALWEIAVSDENLRKTFDKEFCDFIDKLKNMGINNARIDQVRSGFKK